MLRCNLTSMALNRDCHILLVKILSLSVTMTTGTLCNLKALSVRRVMIPDIVY